MTNPTPPGWHPGPPPPPAKKNHRPALIVGGVIFAVLFVVGLIGAINEEKGDDESASAAPTTTVTTTKPLDPSVAAAASAAQSRASEAAAASASAQAAADASAAAVAAAARQREEAAKLDRATYEEVGDRGWALIAKNPDAHIGEKVKLYGKVTQFDSATGTSAFRADTEGVLKDAGYEYDVNTVVNEGTPGVFGKVVEDDLFIVYATVAGSKSYETTMGGETTVPELTAYVVDVTGSDG